MKKPLFFLILLSLTLDFSGVKQAIANESTPRLLVLYAPSVTDPRLTKAEESLRPHKDALALRDVIITKSIPFETSHAAKPFMDHDTLLGIRRTYNIRPDDFKIVLIGRDGGVKLIQEQTDFPEIIATIDSMPMGALEKRIRKKGG